MQNNNNNVPRKPAASNKGGVPNKTPAPNKGGVSNKNASPNKAAPNRNAAPNKGGVSNKNASPNKAAPNRNAAPNKGGVPNKNASPNKAVPNRNPAPNRNARNGEAKVIPPKKYDITKEYLGFTFQNIEVYKRTDADQYIENELKKEGYRGLLRTLCDSINNGTGHAASSVLYQPIVNQTLQNFFKVVNIPQTEIGNGESYLIQNWTILRWVVNNYNKLNKNQKDIFRDDADPWTQEINSFANNQKHKAGVNNKYDYTNYILKPFNVMMHTLDLIMGKDYSRGDALFSNYCLSGTPDRGIYFGEMPLKLKGNSYDIYTNPEDKEFAVRLYFQIVESSFPVRKNIPFVGRGRDQQCFHVKCRSAIDDQEFRNAYETKVEVEGLYYIPSNKNPRNDFNKAVLLPPYKGSDTQHNPEKDFFEVALNDKMIKNNNNFIFKLKVTYKDKRNPRKRNQVVKHICYCYNTYGGDKWEVTN